MSSPASGRGIWARIRAALPDWRVKRQHVHALAQICSIIAALAIAIIAGVAFYSTFPALGLGLAWLIAIASGAIELSVYWEEVQEAFEHLWRGPGKELWLAIRWRAKFQENFSADQTLISSELTTVDKEKYSYWGQYPGLLLRRDPELAQKLYKMELTQLLCEMRKAKKVRPNYSNWFDNEIKPNLSAAAQDFLADQSKFLPRQQRLYEQEIKKAVQALWLEKVSDFLRSQPLEDGMDLKREFHVKNFFLWFARLASIFIAVGFGFLTYEHATASLAFVLQCFLPLAWTSPLATTLSILFVTIAGITFGALMFNIWYAAIRQNVFRKCYYKFKDIWVPPASVAAVKSDKAPPSWKTRGMLAAHYFRAALMTLGLCLVFAVAVLMALGVGNEWVVAATACLAPLIPGAGVISAVMIYTAVIPTLFLFTFINCWRALTLVTDVPWSRLGEMLHAISEHFDEMTTYQRLHFIADSLAMGCAIIVAFALMILHFAGEAAIAREGLHETRSWLTGFFYGIAAFLRRHGIKIGAPGLAGWSTFLAEGADMPYLFTAPSHNHDDSRKGCNDCPSGCDAGHTHIDEHALDPSSVFAGEGVHEHASIVLRFLNDDLFQPLFHVLGRLATCLIVVGGYVAWVFESVVGLFGYQPLPISAYVVPIDDDTFPPAEHRTLAWLDEKIFLPVLRWLTGSEAVKAEVSSKPQTEVSKNLIKQPFAFVGLFKPCAHKACTDNKTFPEWVIAHKLATTPRS